MIPIFFAGPPYHEVLMETARAHIDKQGAVALVVACMAGEIFTEQVILFAFKKRGLDSLEDFIRALWSGNNLRNDRSRELYSLLTKDPIEGQSFWPAFVRSVKLRNKVVHSGGPVSRDEAKEACDTMDLVLAHLTKVMERLGAAPDPSAIEATKGGA